ncbi:MAG: hypothetical protein ACOYOH_04730 [Paracraurococcus sp.]|jgi:hypothetical protein
MVADPQPDDTVPAGYRPAIVTGSTVVLTFSLVYFKFIVFELENGPWTKWWAAAAALAAASIFTQFHTLWRALQLRDDRAASYNVTVRWFGAGMLSLLGSLVLSTLASLFD